MVEDNPRQKRPLRFLPVAIDIRDKRVVVIGGGKVAWVKLKTIVLFGARVTVISPEVLPEIEALPVQCILASYDKKFLEGASLVYACTSDRQANRKIGRDSKEKGILCNVADDIDACAFISPAVLVEGDLVVAINSQGRAPGKAKDTRDFIKERIREFLHGN
jgi:precorrin-2 dehydrogenase/sirohydrochlorin ferrochelatase